MQDSLDPIPDARMPTLHPPDVIQAEWVNPFVRSTVNTFATVLACRAVRGQLQLRSGSQPAFDITGLMSLDGKAVGTVAVSLDRKVAISATEHVMGHATGQIDADVVDVVCEMTNMIAGGANNELEHLSMRVGLPSVVSGKNHIISYPSGVATIGIPFETDWGPITVDASIRKAGDAV